MTTTQTEGLVIKLRRFTLTSDRNARFAKTCYEFVTPVDIDWKNADGSTRPGPRAGSWTGCPGSGLADAKKILKRTFGSSTTFIETWKV